MKVLLVSASPRFVGEPSRSAAAAAGVTALKQIEVPVLGCKPTVVQTVAELKRELAQASEVHDPVVVHFACALSDDGKRLLFERDVDQPPFPDALDASQVGALFAAFHKTNKQLLLVFDAQGSHNFADGVATCLSDASTVSLEALQHKKREALARDPKFWSSFYAELKRRWTSSEAGLHALVKRAFRNVQSETLKLLADAFVIHAPVDLVDVVRLVLNYFMICVHENV